MLFIEIQVGKEAMENKKYCNIYPKSVALILRLTEFLHGHGHVVHGDSAFASVATCTALLEHSTYFSGFLKTAHKEFPKMFCQAHRQNVMIQSQYGLLSRCMVLPSTSNNGHVWNEPGNIGSPK